MWRLAVSELSNKTVYTGQKVLFMGTIKTQVASVFVNGHKVQSAFFSKHTRPVFRSESARYILFVQMSREMWDFNSEGTGEIMFNKVVNGFLPALFKKWAQMKARHLVSIVLFTRVEYDTGMTSELDTSMHDGSYFTGRSNVKKKPYKDFYRVVVGEHASAGWKGILHALKREFKFFRRDISMHRLDSLGVRATRMEATPSLAMYGNILEAINMATSQFAQDHIDRDLVRTGISIIVITPSAGVFEVEHDTLRLTTELLLCNGMGIDLVCLPKMPLHSTPVFRYLNPDYAAFHDGVHFKSFRSEESTPRPNGPLSTSTSSLGGSVSPVKTSLPDRSVRSGNSSGSAPPQLWCYAMPNWVDVSYWTGTEQHRLGNLGKDDYGHKKGLQTASNFDVRCKMYELEMSSIMEDAMTEISVLPLQQDPLFPQMIIGPRGVPDHQFGAEVSEVIPREKVYGAFTEYVGGPARSLMDRHGTPAETAFWKALELFDMARSEIAEDPLPHKHSSKKGFKTGSEETVMKALVEASNIFGTSVPDEHGGAFKGIDLLKEPQVQEHKLASRKNSVGTTMTPAKTSPAKPFKFGRQISFGKQGFGIAAPKVATAAIQAEHANAIVPNATSSYDSKKSTDTMANHLLSPPRPQDQPNTPSKEQTRQRSTSQSTNTLLVPENDVEKRSRPMTVRSAVQDLDSKDQTSSRSLLDTHRIDPEEIAHALQAGKADDTYRVFNSKLLAGAMADPPRYARSRMLPWLVIKNPSNSKIGHSLKPAKRRRWQYIYPRPMLTQTLKWKSLCSPASVPLTTEYFPTKYQLDTEYQQNAYNITRNTDDELSEVPKTEEFLRELVGLRLAQGYQIVTGPAVAEAFGQKSLKIANGFDSGPIAGDRVSVFMSMGNIIHQLSCTDGTEVEVNVFRRKLWTSSDPESSAPIAYNPAIRTVSAHRYDTRQVLFGQPRNDFNWNYVDNYTAGFDEEMSEHLRFWRARFVLIPLIPPSSGQRTKGEDTPEEVRLEGLRKITQMWQRHRCIPAAERAHQSIQRKPKDPNPLDIIYRTEDPSIIVIQELDALLEAGDGTRRGASMSSERFRKSKLDMQALVEAIQAPVSKGGIRMQNRRWHFRLHYNCFIGSDMTTWLLENFEDVEDREEAVELGNRLMVKEDTPTPKDKENGIFVHVERRHPFRDGQYFYQISGENAKRAPDIKSSWFAAAKRRQDASVPSTPVSEVTLRDSPKPERAKSSSGQDDTDSGATTPTTSTANTNSKRSRVALSKVMKYDVDTRKRSYRTERINLHYDRLHNPDSCYHIRIDWVSVTAKLIEDAVESWATTAERYGMRLVEAPVGEACTIGDVHPFRAPYEIKLASRPPAEKPRTHYDANSFEPSVQSGSASRHYYQKAIMKKFNFVLDTEAARNFPSNIDVTYSWGRPDFKYTQYIHRSGMALVEITDDGDFILIANRLYNNRTAAVREQDRFVKKDLAERRLHSKDQQTGQSAPWSTSPMLRPAPMNPITTNINPLTSPLLKPISHTSTSSSLENPLIPSASAPPSTQTSVGLGPTPTHSTPTSDISIYQRPSSSFSFMTGLQNTVDSVKEELEAFCYDAHALELFYREVYNKSSSPTNTSPVTIPHSSSSLFTSPRLMSPGESIPTLGLPPGISGSEGSNLSLSSSGISPGQTMNPSAGSGGLGMGMGLGVGYVRGALGAFGRRPSVNKRPSLQFGLGIGTGASSQQSSANGLSGSGNLSGNGLSGSALSGAESSGSAESPRGGSAVEEKWQ